ncbi:MAG TPA: hypothetical protein PLI97_03170 [Fluviicola sp.]|nr:hypothetical protein [Fluviicola sp.]
MNTSIQHQINLFKEIENMCVKNNDVWSKVPEFRGAFSRFALKVAQLDLLVEQENIQQPLFNKLLTEITQILNQSFDRYFDYLKSKYCDLCKKYFSIRSSF